MKPTHLKRWITGVLALPVVVYLIVGGPLLFWCLLAVVSVLSLWEYYQVVLRTPGTDHPAVFMWLGLIWAPVVLASPYIGGVASGVMCLTGNLLVCGIVSVFRFGGMPGALDAIFRQTFGLIYIPAALSLLIPIRTAGAGWEWILFVLFVVFAGDIGAYYVGSYCGRRKLCPLISPGKTVEGAAGGVAANLAAGSLMKAVFFPQLPWPESLLMFLAIGLVGQAGDLFESQIKRAAGVKDSGTLLPGHGGFLDRIDAILFAAPLAYVFRFFILA